VFEGVSGAALLKLLPQPQSWERVRYWLFDLATEISVAEKEGTLPVLALDRVWITAEGRAKLLDFPAPGLQRSANAKTTKTADGDSGANLLPQQFLREVARVALGNSRDALDKRTNVSPVPLHAGRFLEGLPTLPNAEAIIAALKPLLRRVATVSRWRRAGVIAGSLAFPLITAVGMIFGMRVYDQWQRSQPQLGELVQLLNHRSAMKMPFIRQSRLDDRTYGIYIASHFREIITNPNQWNTLYAVSTISGDKRRFAEQSLVNYPNPTNDEIRNASVALQPLLKPNMLSMGPNFPLLVFGVSLLIYVALPALLAALIFRNGLVLLAFGVAVVKRNGARASRLHVFGRSLVAWSPVLVGPVFMVMLSPLIGMIWTTVLLSVLIVGFGAWSLALPGRGLQDRIAGTTLVPR
jgi:hypothetical protein